MTSAVHRVVFVAKRGTSIGQRVKTVAQGMKFGSVGDVLTSENFIQLFNEFIPNVPLHYCVTQKSSVELWTKKEW